MEVEDVQMQIQSFLCQLRVKDMEKIAKTLGCGDSQTKSKKRKEFVKLTEEKLEYLEEFKVKLMEYTPLCPPLENIIRRRIQQALNPC